jgi:hypothetical protein
VPLRTPLENLAAIHRAVRTAEQGGAVPPRTEGVSRC